MDSMKYDMMISTPGISDVPSKIFVKKNQMRVETSQAGINMVILIDVDKQEALLYLPDQNNAMKLERSNALTSALADAQSILNYQPQIDGTETVDGKVCTVVAYTVDTVPTKCGFGKIKDCLSRSSPQTHQGKQPSNFKIMILAIFQKACLNYHKV